MIIVGLRGSGLYSSFDINFSLQSLSLSAHPSYDKRLQREPECVHKF